MATLMVAWPNALSTSLLPQSAHFPALRISISRISPSQPLQALLCDGTEDSGDIFNAGTKAEALHFGENDAEVQPNIEPVTLSSIASLYNDINIVEIPTESKSIYAGARLLLLDWTGNIHSVYKKDSNWTGSYWDEFSTLPPIIPEGPIAILGLGAGTAARLMLDLWPSRKLEGWEIDEILVDHARMHLGLSDIEGPNDHGGGLSVHIGDAFCADVDGGFAGIVVDLFSDGAVLPPLHKVETWAELRSKLKPGGRIMVNCVEEADFHPEDDNVDPLKDRIICAMAKVFQNELSWRQMDGTTNKMALSGPFPNLETWETSVPEVLKKGLSNWRPLFS